MLSTSPRCSLGDWDQTASTDVSRGLSYGSLSNGIYDLSLQGSLVQDVGGGYTSSDRTWTFHRLIADYGGNGIVDSADQAYLGSGWQTAAGQPGYLEGMDLNSDRHIDLTDMSILAANWQRTLTYTSTTTPVFTGVSTTGTAGSAMSYVGQSLEYYYNESYQVMEVRRSGSANPLEQYVYDQRYIDAPVMVYRDTNTDGTADQKLYVTQDANFDVTAVVDGTSGNVVNRFIYTPYGQRTVLTSTWAAGTTDFMLGHQGLYLDGESGLYYNRARYLHPTLGSFIQRDPLGYVDGANVYQAEDSRPTMTEDPGGTAPSSQPTTGPTSQPTDPDSMCEDKERLWVVVANRGGENQQPGASDLPVWTGGHIDVFGIGKSGGVGFCGRNVNRWGVGRGCFLDDQVDWFRPFPDGRPMYVNGTDLSILCAKRLCPKQVAKMNAQYEKLKAKPPQFNLALRNCSDVASSILRAGHVNTGPGWTKGQQTPMHLIDSLQHDDGWTCFVGSTRLLPTGGWGTIPIRAFPGYNPRPPRQGQN